MDKIGKRLLKIVWLTLHDEKEDSRYIRLTQCMANMKMERKFKIFFQHIVDFDNGLENSG